MPSWKKCTTNYIVGQKSFRQKLSSSLETDTGDKLTGQGMTSIVTKQPLTYLSMCPVFDDDEDGGFGDYFYKSQ